MRAKDLLDLLCSDDPAAGDLKLALRASELRQEHGGHWESHPKYHLDEWENEVFEGNTRLGYWEWVVRRCQDEDYSARITLHQGG